MKQKLILWLWELLRPSVEAAIAAAAAQLAADLSAEMNRRGVPSGKRFIGQ
jgi:hypothetical protein